MSFILDALKKSEAERQRPQAPTLLDLPAGQRQRGVPVWLLIVIALLLVNLTVMLMLWLRPTGTNTNASAAQDTTTRTVVSTTTATTPRVISGNVRSLENEATLSAINEPPSDTVSTTLDVSTPQRTPLVTRVKDASNDSNSRTDNPANNGQASTNNSTPRTTGVKTLGAVPTLDSLGGSSAFNLPNLTLNLHVYDAQAVQRFVFINGKRYQEGGTLSEGPLVENITADGAVLSYQGRSFLLPR